MSLDNANLDEARLSEVDSCDMQIVSEDTINVPPTYGNAGEYGHGEPLAATAASRANTPRRR